MFFAVIAAIVLPWIMRPGYLFFVDLSWGPIINIDWGGSYLIPTLIFKLLNILLPSALIEKIFISAILLFILYGGQKLVKSVLKIDNDETAANDTWLVFGISLFALFNPFVYDRALYGQFGILAAYGALLFTAAFFIEAWILSSPKKMFWGIIFSSISLMFSLHFGFFLFFIYFLFFLALLHAKGDIKKHQMSKKMFFYMALAILFVIALNANWLLTKSLSSFSTLGNTINNEDLQIFKTTGNSPREILTNIFFLSGFWAKDLQRYVDISTLEQNWGRSFLIIFPLILAGMAKGLFSFKKNKKLFYFTLGAVLLYGIAFLLAIGISLPIGEKITRWLIEKNNFYKVMREPQKWETLITLVYISFLTIGASIFFKIQKIKRHETFFKILLTFLIVLQAPLLLWGFARQVRAVDYPTDWHIANAIVTAPYEKNEKCQDKILFLPWHQYMAFEWIGGVVANPAKLFFRCPTISGTNMEAGNIYDASGDAVGQNVAAWFFSRGNTSLLKTENISYIILAKEVDWKQYEWLDSLDGLQLIENSNTLKLYKVLK